MRKRKTEKAGSRIRLALKKISACIISASFVLTSSSHIALAKKGDYDDSKGFDDDKQQEVWMVYGITSWEDVSGIIFSNSRMISTNIPTEFKEKWTKTVKSVLEENKQDSVFSKGDYLPLILTMLYHINKKGNSVFNLDSWHEKSQSDIEAEKKKLMEEQGMSEEDAQEQAEKSVVANSNDEHGTDVAFTQHLFGRSDAPENNEASIGILINEFFTSERRMMNASGGSEDFSYAIDDVNSPGLWCVVQATIYSGSKGHDYAAAEPVCEYGKDDDKPKKFREKYDDVASYDGFADDVKSDYNATKVENYDDAVTDLTGLVGGDETN
jgi:hypothetical protein